MKKFLSLLLALSMIMMTMVIVPISVSAVASLPVSDNFDGSTTIDTTKWDKVSKPNESPGATIVAGTSYGRTGNVVKLNGADYANFGIKTTDCVPDAFKVTFDVYVPDTFANCELKLKGGSNDELLYIKKDKMTYTSKAGSASVTTTTNTWYNVVYEIDTTTGNTTMTVTPEGGTATTVSGKFTSDLNDANEIYFQQFYMVANSTYALLDNVSISKVESTSGGEDSGDSGDASTGILPVSDDFEAGTTIDAKWTKVSANHASIVSGADYGTTGNVLKLSTGDYKNFGVVTTGEEPDAFKVKFDVYMSDTYNNSELKLKGGSNDELLYVKKGTINYTSAAGGKSVAVTTNTWYTVEFIVDSTGASTTTVTPKGGEATTITGSFASLNTANEIYFQAFYLSANSAYALLDNVSIEKYTGTVSGGDDGGEQGGTTTTTGTLPVSDTFNDSTKVNTTKWNKVSNADKSPGYSIISGAEYGADGNVLKADGTDYNNFGIKLNSAKSTGAFKIKYDLYVPEGFKSEMKLYSGDKAILYLQSLNINGGFGVGSVGKVTANAWNTVELICDIDSSTVTCTLTTPDGTEARKSGVAKKDDVAIDMTNTNEIFLQAMYMNTNSNYVLIDNLSIEDYVIPTVELPIVDDFSGGKINTEIWNNISATASQVYVEDGAVHMGDIYLDQGFAASLDEPITSGKIRLNYDVYATKEFMTQTEVKDGETKPVHTEVLFYIGDGYNSKSRFIYFKPNETTVGGVGGSVLKPTADTWYNFDVIYNITTKEFTLVVTNKSTEETYSKSGTSTKDITAVSHLGFGMVYANEGTKAHVLVDNVSFTRYYEVPKMESVTFVKYDDTTSTALTNVAAGTKEIVVKFNTPMDDTTLSNTTMKLEKVDGTTRTAVEYEGVYDDTAITWTIPLDEYLDAASTYELTMTADVKNGAGTKAAETTYEIGTDAGEYVVDISVMKGETEITALSQITKGDTLTIKADVINTTGEDQKLQLIYGGYNGKLLTDYKGYTKDIAKTDKRVEIKDFTVTVDPTNMTQIRLFDWYDFATLKCLSEADTIQ